MNDRKSRATYAREKQVTNRHKLDEFNSYLWFGDVAAIAVAYAVAIVFV